MKSLKFQIQLIALILLTYILIILQKHFLENVLLNKIASTSLLIFSVVLVKNSKLIPKRSKTILYILAILFILLSFFI